MRATRLLITILLLGAACASRNAEIIRHLVIAEVAEKQSVEPSLVEVKSIKFQGEAEATANVEYGQHGSRSPERTKMTCQLTRKADRWLVAACAPAG